jgi:hypothetical protein
MFFFLFAALVALDPRFRGDDGDDGVRSTPGDAAIGAGHD